MMRLSRSIRSNSALELRAFSENLQVTRLLFRC
jgi:hypothetical protein